MPAAQAKHIIFVEVVLRRLYVPDFGRDENGMESSGCEYKD
jgi:hypothetical protein